MERGGRSSSTEADADEEGPVVPNVTRGDGDGGARPWEGVGSRYGVETLEDMADGGMMRFARRKVKKAVCLGGAIE